jgi:hypothetical protein
MLVSIAEVFLKVKEQHSEYLQFVNQFLHILSLFHLFEKYYHKFDQQAH